MKRPHHLFLAASVCLALSTAIAQDDDDPGVYREAGARLADLVVEAQLLGGEQRLATPEANRLVDLLSDQKRFLKAQYTKEEIGELLDLCGTTSQAIVSLSYFNAKAQVDDKAGPQAIAAQLAVVAQKNAITFSQHLRKLASFAIQCAAKQVAPATQLFYSLPSDEITEVRLQGLKQMQFGIAHIIANAVRSLTAAEIDDATKVTLIEDVAESAPFLVPALPLAQRNELRAIAAQARPSAPANCAAALQAIERALENAHCDGLCAVSSRAN